MSHRPIALFLALLALSVSADDGAKISCRADFDIPPGVLDEIDRLTIEAARARPVTDPALRCIPGSELRLLPAGELEPWQMVGYEALTSRWDEIYSELTRRGDVSFLRDRYRARCDGFARLLRIEVCETDESRDVWALDADSTTPSRIDLAVKARAHWWVAVGAPGRSGHGLPLAQLKPIRRECRSCPRRARLEVARDPWTRAALAYAQERRGWIDAEELGRFLP